MAVFMAGGDAKFTGEVGVCMAPSGLGEFAEQMERARNVARHAVGLLDGGRRLVVVHGNGPQVGALALAQEA
ncbi:MAG: hypothetical protein HGA94_04675, partial [Candidatus Aminicenantes bacterium]|nr:hypothetical protein [Candidatus Aminicenantes bacterium]